LVWSALEEGVPETNANREPFAVKETYILVLEISVSREDLVANMEPSSDEDIDVIILELSLKHGTWMGDFDHSPAPHSSTVHLEASGFDSAIEPPNITLGSICTPEADGADLPISMVQDLAATAI